MSHDPLHIAMQEEASRRHCGLLDQNALNADEQLRLHMVRYSHMRNQMLKAYELDLPIEIAMTNGTVFNAVAGKKGDKYFVLMFEGAIAIARRIVHRAFSDPMFLPNMAGARDEEDHRVPVSRTGKPAADLMMANSVEPLSHSRSQLAGLVQTIILDHVLFHELGHIVDGHVDLAPDNYGLQVLSEEVDEIPSALSSWDWQTMEMDADCFAIGACLVSSGSSTIPSEWLDPNLERRVCKNATVWSAYIQCLHMILKLFEKPFSLETMRDYKYPSAQVRMNLMKSSCAAYMRNVFGLSNDVAYGWLEQTIIQAELCYARMFGQHFDQTLYARRVREEYPLHGNGLLANWARIRPMLVPLAKRPDILAKVNKDIVPD